jgi:hypothetical protein
MKNIQKIIQTYQELQQIVKPKVGGKKNNLKVVDTHVVEVIKVKVCV